MSNSKAVTKIQTISLIAITLIALASGAAAFYFSNTDTQQDSQPTPTISTEPTKGATAKPSEPTLTPPSSTEPTATLIPTTNTQTPTLQSKDPIIIGICADLDTTLGASYVAGATLAIDQINAGGGLLGRNLAIVQEDDDSQTPPYDNAVATNALNRLITVDKADYVMATSTFDLSYQDICSQQKKILFVLTDPKENLTQRVIDNYEKYKYTFRGEYLANATTMDLAHVQSLALLKNITGFTKVGYLMYDSPTTRQQTAPYFENELPKLGYQIVYRALFAPSTMDFTSYFAQAETAKTQILFVIQTTVPGCAAIVNEWHNRQSPMLLCGDMMGVPDYTFWNITSGNTEFAITKNVGLSLLYPITKETNAVRDAFLARWGQPMRATSASAYDVVKFFLAGAINRAGTTETDAVIKALEGTNVDTVLTNDFRFTSNHDIYVEASGMMNLSKTTMLYIVIQWQNGVQVPIFPESLRIAAGATLKYPPWSGPWK
jgi:branched-chain amino acid transport system substrate-binding protein